jgi:hypothetical protein
MKSLSELKVKTIVRLNEHLYDKEYFISRGLEHIDLIFPDGSVPNKVRNCKIKGNCTFILELYKHLSTTVGNPLQSRNGKNRYSHWHLPDREI